MRRLGLLFAIGAFAVGVSVYFARVGDLAQSRPEVPVAGLAASASSGSDGADATRVSAISKPGAGAAGAEAAATPEDRAKVGILDAILRSKNDNDPRLDHELKILSAGAKTLMRGRYAAFARERLNERGTIVFLLGRNVQTLGDVAFLHDVLSEPACLSLADCAKDSGGGANHDAHSDDELGSQVTLAYPQLVALKSIERLLASAGVSGAIDPSVLAAARAEVAAARGSPVAKVAGLAQALWTKLNRK